MSKTSVIILNFNRKKEVLRLLKNLEDQTFTDFETIVVDNCSSDGSVVSFKKEFPEVKVVSLPKNYGKAGFNFGMEKARGKYLVLFDSDILPKKDVVKKYVDKLENNPKLGLVCPEVFLPDGRFFGPKYSRKVKRKDGGFDVLFFAGGSIALRREVFKKTGGYEERYFMCLEELEWAVRVRVAGYQVRVFPEIRVVEQKVLSGAEYRERLGFYYSRNWIWFYAKYLPIAFWPNFIIRHMGSARFRAGKEMSMKYNDILKGLVAGFFGIGGFIKERMVMPNRMIEEVEQNVFIGEQAGWREGVSTRREDDFKKNLPSLQF